MNIQLFTDRSSFTTYRIDFIEKIYHSEQSEQSKTKKVYLGLNLKSLIGTIGSFKNRMKNIQFFIFM